MATAVLVGALGLAAGRAEAYPYFQSSSGTDTCGACHLSPSGGGPLSEWGRGAAGDTLARGGDGRFLHGLVELPPWLDVGGGLRLAALVNDTGNASGAEVAVFPMQAELGVRLGTGAWSVVASAGVIGAVRRPPTSETGVAPTAPAVPWLGSREHYVMWRAGEQGAYVRAGKFALPYGLRDVDHTTYVRRQLGLGLGEEPYAIAAGYLGASWDVHATAFTADRWRGDRAGGRGGAVMVERRHGAWSATVDARVTAAPDDTRALVGLTAKLWREPESILWMVEVDGGRQWLAGLTRPQVASYAGLVWLPVRGLAVGLAHELFDEDLGRGGDTRHAADLWTTFLPRAHLEVGLSTRYQWIGPDGRAAMALLQLHYFL